MKRAHNPPKAAHKAHKRQKLENSLKPTRKQKRRVQLNELGWKTVSMPDRLEDTEGFYGLEEIDDVDIVKDPTTGNITFQTTKTEEEVEKDVEAAWRREEEEAARLEKMIGQEGKELPVEGETEAAEEAEAEIDNDSFAGFSDEDIEDAPAKTGGIDIEDLDPNSAIEDGRALKKDKVEKKPEKAKTKKEKKAEAKAKREEEKLKQNTAANAGANPDYVEEEGAEATEDFEISGEGAFDILLNQPVDDDEVDTSAWEELNLSEKVVGALAGLKFSKPSLIQAATIPEIMAGRDLIGKASTGSGKTLAFGIPIIERYLATRSAHNEDAKTQTIPTALIIAPTRELAHQITAHLTDLCVKGDFDAPSIATITGGLSVQKQRRQLEKADVVVGTPGRLWEVISSGQGLLRALKQVKFLVLDEADRLLSQGHYQELGEILKVLDKVDDEEDEEEPTPEVERQTLVFSATFQKGLQQKLAGKVKFGNGTGDIMNKADSMEYLLKKLNFREEQPRFIDANPESQMASKLREGLIECAGPEKDLYLYSLLLFHPNKRALIFTNSISAVRRLTPFLANLNLPALPLHSSMIQKARLRSIERFKSRPGSILVATDVAARGLDIPKVDLVIHYHLPRAADTYVHRSGRTARADASGSSIIICAPEEVAGVRRLVAKVHARAESAQQQKNKKRAYFIRTLDIDRRIVSRLKPRATLSKKLADTVIAKEKKNSTDDMFMQAAEDLGIDYDSEEFEKEAKGKKGRGSGRKKKEKNASEMTRAEFASIRHELRGLLAERINTGVSAKYLTSGGIDVEALMKGEGNTGFLGAVDGLGFDDELDKPTPAPIQDDEDEEEEDEDEDPVVDGDADADEVSKPPSAASKPEGKSKKQKSRKRNADGTKKKWIHH
ncbi:RNA helicase [Ascochyta rabiei]|uniref:RNA helicase n=1 Tax=Didymella rabiei TaxID=5454 RepID=A0A163L205_DIDRA|nr:RNA helicase [Ascochyta rabiei]KZM27442.1 ATP binding [Ascochyta rabiei]UPX20455.1 RNA helicase [Ascochyta rabiei]